MKAILAAGHGGPEIMDLAEIPRPKVKANQVLIRVRATSVNKPDIMQRLGLYPPPQGESPILGLEVAGVVEQVGARVSKWQAGDEVLALVAGGGYAEYCAAYEHHVMPKPAALDFLQAACICETYITAYLNVFMLGRVAEKTSVLLHGGGGGVNTAAIHLCNQLTPEVITFVTCSTAKAARVQALGVDHVIDYQQHCFADEIDAITTGKGVDLILDHIGAAYHLQNMRSLAYGGTLMQIGVSEGAKTQINLALLMVKRQQIIGSVLRSRSIDEKAAIIRQFDDVVMPLFAENQMRPLISDVLPLAQASTAHQIMENSQHFGKIVLKI